MLKYVVSAYSVALRSLQDLSDTIKGYIVDLFVLSINLFSSLRFNSHCEFFSLFTCVESSDNLRFNQLMSYVLLCTFNLRPVLS